MSNIKYTVNGGEPFTPEYKAHDWEEGEVLAESRLDAMEQGIQYTNEGVRALEAASVEVRTLEAGSAASASYDSTSSTWVFNLPKGDTGAQGEKGDQGEQGIAGPKGDKGDTGPQGPQGEQGPQGDKGDKGDKGDTGDQGPAGAQGEQGPQGEKGEKGDKGDTGEAGAAGAKGADGHNGVSLRLSASAVTASSANALTGLTPVSEEQPVQKNDIVLDATTKALYVITAVDDANYTVGAAVATLP